MLCDREPPLALPDDPDRRLGREPAGDLDRLGAVAGGAGYDEILPHSTVLRVFGLDVRVVTLEQLIRLKSAAGRPRDLEVIAELELLLAEREGDLTDK